MFSKLISIIVLLPLSFAVFGQDAIIVQEEKKEYTPEQKAKLKQAKEFANKFIERWHETLDLKIMFAEFFIRNPNYLQQNYHLFSKPETCKKCTKEEIEQVFFAYFNAYYLWVECSLAFNKREFESPLEVMPLGIIRAYRNWNKLDEKLGEPLSVSEEFSLLTKKSNSFSQVMRKYLPASIFYSDAYKAGMMEEFQTTEIRAAKLHDTRMSLIDVDENIPVYYVEIGIFEIDCIEENGQFRVLTLVHPE